MTLSAVLVSTRMRRAPVHVLSKTKMEEQVTEKNLLIEPHKVPAGTIYRL